MQINIATGNSVINATQDGVTEKLTVTTEREKLERHIEQKGVIVSEMKDKEELTIGELSILDAATYYLKDGLLHLKQ